MKKIRAGKYFYLPFLLWNIYRRPITEIAGSATVGNSGMEPPDWPLHAEAVIVLLSIVTAPVCARARPFKVAPLFRVMLVRARIFPMNEVLVSRVAELPILHHTLHGSPPVTDEPGDVMSVDADLKIQTPDPLSTRFPVSLKSSAQ
jgi:hypothetical protein